MWALVDLPGARPRIFNYSPEYLDLPGHCKHMFVGSLRIKIIRSFSQEAIKYHKGTLQYPRKIYVQSLSY